MNFETTVTISEKDIINSITYGPDHKISSFVKSILKQLADEETYLDIFKWMAKDLKKSYKESGRPQSEFCMKNIINLLENKSDYE